MYRRQSLQEGGEGELDTLRDEPTEDLWWGSSAVGVPLLSTAGLFRHGQELAISKAARAKMPWSRNGCSKALVGTRFCHIGRSSHAGVDILGAVMVDHRCMSCSSSSCWVGGYVIFCRDAGSSLLEGGGGCVLARKGKGDLVVELQVEGLEGGVASPRAGEVPVVLPALVRDDLGTDVELRIELVGVAMEKLTSVGLGTCGTCGTCGTLRCVFDKGASDIVAREVPASALSPKACNIDAESPPSADVDLKPVIEGNAALAFRSTLVAVLCWTLP